MREEAQGPRRSLLCDEEWQKLLLGTAPPAPRGPRLVHLGRFLTGWRGAARRALVSCSARCHRDWGGELAMFQSCPWVSRLGPLHSTGHRTDTPPPQLALWGLIFCFVLFVLPASGGQEVRTRSMEGTRRRAERYLSKNSQALSSGRDAGNPGEGSKFRGKPSSGQNSSPLLLKDQRVTKAPSST